MQKALLLMIPFAVMGCWSIPFLTDTSLPDWEKIENETIWLYNGNGIGQWVVMGDPQHFRETGGNSGSPFGFLSGITGGSDQPVEDVKALHIEGTSAGEWLRTEQEFGDFVLRLDYRVSAGAGSGVFFRSAAEGNPAETGYKVPLSSEQPPRDDLHSTGSLQGYAPANPRPDESPEVWHSLEIVCKQKRILVFIDGINTVNLITDQIQALQNKPNRGSIGLQAPHEPEGAWVEFRNIRIREL